MKQSTQKTAVFFCDEWYRDEFLNPFVSALGKDQDWKIVWETENVLEVVGKHAGNADLLWFDHFSPFLVESSNQVDLSQPCVVCRISGTDYFKTNLGLCKWEHIDHLVAAHQYSFDILLRQFNRLESYCQMHVIPPAITPGQNRIADKKQTNNIAYVGLLGEQYNSQMLLQSIERLRKQGLDYKLHIVGDFEDLSIRFYFEQLLGKMNLGERVTFEQPPENWAEWYHDKSYFLCPAIFPGQEANIFRAMAAGLKPLVHEYFGAEEFFDQDCRFNSLDELCDLLQQDRADLPNDSWQPEDYHRKVAEKHNLQIHLPDFLKLFKDNLKEQASPRISIVIPTYNRAPLIKRMILDLEKQTYPNLEVVVSDDCSTDNTAEILRELQQRQSNLHCIRNDKNVGPCDNTAKAVEKASGEYVIICSDDDLLDHNAVAQFARLAVRKNADLVYSDLGILDSEGNETTVWKFRNYYDNLDLLRDLIYSGCNRIPEVFMCRREIFDKLYMDTYGRRFLGTYFLPHIRQIKMIHLPKPLYKYTVHQQSVFSSIKGLYNRVKGTQNYINAALFMYSPVDIFQIDQRLPAAEQIATAFHAAASVIVQLGTGFVEGEFYTGVKYQREDQLHKVYFYNAWHWLKMAQTYGLPSIAFNSLADKIKSYGDPLDFDPVTTVNVPSVYRQLPWFAFTTYNAATSFVALDILSVDAPDWLNQTEYKIYSDERIKVAVCNHQAKTGQEFDEIISGNPVTVVNLFSEHNIEQVIQYLMEHHLFSVYVLNFSKVRIPRLEILRNIYNVADQTCSDFNDYLRLLTRITSVEHEHTPVQTIS